MIRVLIVVGTLLVVCQPAGAQERVARSFEQLQLLVGSGDTVSVQPENGVEVTGRITTLSATQLVMAIGGSTTVFEGTQPLRVRQRRGDSLKNGALIGLGIGVGLAALAIAATGDELSSDDAGWLFLATGIYGAMGTGIGVGVDALIRGRPVIYERRAPAVVSRQPIIGTRRLGATVAFRF